MTNRLSQVAEAQLLTNEFRSNYKLDLKRMSPSVTFSLHGCVALEG
ncbi:hypothetical protein FEAC_29140 [Ferrimicrobium acidiphilum DSM 19497]|uniref:Uncharacterized protein n=1 Tax=Ferrimicrobium acidiphilum DSM 19497 TaxID=1121877 RepID=A0A0D8FSW7_9ACTN|nr:hypothetical protein FEAC_29140 [Ferrimicrobium acidiphilum DSM 19497]